VDKELIIGRRRIMAFFGINSWRTIGYWRQNYSLPIRLQDEWETVHISTGSAHLPGYVR